jgi:hypothetical protein
MFPVGYVEDSWGERLDRLKGGRRLASLASRRKRVPSLHIEVSLVSFMAKEPQA